jgi:hypothetical protein
MRTAQELATVDDPAWPILIETATDGVEIIPIDRAQGLKVLERLQVTARSGLGALALNCGGIVADRGWFRLFGGGSEFLPDLASINGLAEFKSRSAPAVMVVGCDVLGGRFAIDGGGLGVAPGEVCYFGPDTLSWDTLGLGHSDFVSAALSGALGEAFADLRWDGWESEVAALASDQGIHCWPPPSTVEGKDLGSVSRRAVPIDELFASL